MTTGIYGIFGKNTHECLYIGQSRNIEQRWKQHKKLLRNKKHPRKDFVEWFDKNNCAIKKMDFRVVKELPQDVTDKELNIQEIYFFEQYKPKFYGKEPSQHDTWIHSESTKEKIRTSVLKKIYDESGTQERMSKHCPICNSIVVQLKNTYCSVDCYKESLNVERTSACVVCHSVMIFQRFRKTCSDSCHQKLIKLSNGKSVTVDEKRLYQLFVVENRSISDIAACFNVSRPTIYKFLKKYGLKS